MSARRALRQHRVPFLSMAAVAAAVLAGCSGSSAPSGGGSASSGSAASGSGSGPVVIGTSLSLTGDFSQDLVGIRTTANADTMSLNFTGTPYLNRVRLGLTGNQ